MSGLPPGGSFGRLPQVQRRWTDVGHRGPDAGMSQQPRDGAGANSRVTESRAERATQGVKPHPRETGGGGPPPEHAARRRKGAGLPSSFLKSSPSVRARHPPTSISKEGTPNEGYGEERNEGNEGAGDWTQTSTGARPPFFASTFSLSGRGWRGLIPSVPDAI